MAKRSVTELEILHGVLNDPDIARRSFYYSCDFKAQRDVLKREVFPQFKQALLVQGTVPSGD